MPKKLGKLSKKKQAVTDKTEAAEKPKEVLSVSSSHFEAANVPTRFRESRWADVPEVRYKRVLVNYVKRLDEMLEQGRGLLLWGPNRRGKTAAASLVLREAMKRKHDCFFVRAAEYVDDKRRIKSFEEMSDITLEEMAQDSALLVFDDMGKELERFGSAAIEIDNLIRHRDAEKRATIVTTNVPLNQMGEVFKESTIALMRECMYPVQVDEVDYAKQSMDWLEERLGDE